jgi:phage shock protein C
MDMGVFDIGFVAVILAFGYAFYEQHTKTKVKLQNGSAGNDALKQEIDNLKQRIATLEAIVTDKSYDLKSQINRL